MALGQYRAYMPLYFKKSGDLVIALADTASFKKNEYFLVNIGDFKKKNYFFNEYSGV